MELDWFEDFLVLADTAHFSRAAEIRNISQPAFSRRIKMLENWVGTPLFNRDTHRIELTPAGQEWRPVAEDVLRTVKLGRQRARETAETDRSTINLAAIHALSINFFPNWLEEIEKHSDLGASLNIVTGTTAQCAQKILHGEAHFLLSHHHPYAPNMLPPNHFISLAIGQDVLIPVCAAQPGGNEPLFVLPGTRDAPIPHLTYAKNSGIGQTLAASLFLDPPNAWLTPTFIGQIATVLVTMSRGKKGVAWLPKGLIERDLAAGNLVLAGEERWHVPLEIRLYRPRARQSVVAENFWKIIKNMAA
jgi:DNA-binding transcriptional LysR family regulator